MKVKITDECIGCGLCQDMCPQVFQLDTSNISQVVGDPQTHADSVEEAAAACLVAAILVE